MCIQLYIYLDYMIDPDDLRMFDTLARTPSLAAAARDLGVTPPALTVRLKKIEHALGARPEATSVDTLGPGLLAAP